MKIVQLTSQNVKRLKAVQITPSGEMVVIGGNNGNGKTSVLDSIMYALAGKSAVPSMPIRKGEKSAEIEVDLGDIKVVRRFTEAGGTTLKVVSKEGASFPSPQKMLDDLIGRLSFDPIEFSRMKPAEQSRTLCDLVGIDTGELDAKRKGVYEERTSVNRTVKTLESRLAGMVRHADAPDAEVSVSEAADAYNRAVLKNDDITGLQKCIEESDAELVKLREQLEIEVRHNQQLRDGLLQLGEKVDTEPLRQQMQQSEATNRKVRENAAYAEQSQELEDSKGLANRLTTQIETIDIQKAKMIREAAYPIEGLGIDEEGRVMFGGIPFDQCSGAEQVRVSVAMGLAMNPKLRVLLIRDGSLLDEESLRLVSEMAHEADAQVWIERVGKGKEVEVIIEDGMVVEREAAVTA